MSKEKQTRLEILLNETPLGDVTRAGDKLTFTYHEDARWSPQTTLLSLSMPLTKAEHTDPTISNFLWGLLPDNELIINAWAQREHVSPKSVFQLIGAIGEDLPGAIQAGYAEQIEDFATRDGARRISKTALAEHIQTMLRSPGRTQLTEHGGKFSLAGAQTKKALNWTNGVFYDPQGRTPSTHILKPPISGLDGQVENEHFCLRLASKLKIRAARSNVVQFDDLAVIIVERFDRLRVKGQKRLPLSEAGGKVIRVHQEDMCQALGVHPSNKYQNAGGPGVAQIMNLLAGSQRAAEDRTMFMRAIALNYVIGGTDAHAKNYSILHLPGGVFRMAPLYDVISGLPYEDRHKDRKLAMSIGGEYRYDKIGPRHWYEQANACKLNPDATLDMVRSLIAELPDHARDELEECRSKKMRVDTLGTLVDRIATRCKELSSIFASAHNATSASANALKTLD